MGLDPGDLLRAGNLLILLKNKAVLATACFIVSSFTFASDAVQVYFNHYQQESYQDPYRKIYRRGHNLEQVLIDAVMSAEESIYVAVQELRLPNLAKALVKRKKEGIDVKVILENHYNNTLLTIKDPNNTDPDEHESSKYIEFFALVDINRDGNITEAELDQRDAIHILKKAGIPIKDDTFDRSNGSGLMHHKFMVVDRKNIIVSTANFTMSGIHGDILHPSTEGNANSMLTLKSHKLSSYFLDEFFLMWGGMKEKKPSLFGMNKPYRGRQSTTVYGSKVTVQFSPTTKNSSWRKSVNGLIASELEKANSEVLMALFVFSEQKLANVLKKKYEASHQFRIGLLVEPKFAYRNYSEMLDMWGIQLRDENCMYERGNRPWTLPLYDIGVPAMARGDMLHHKFAVIDESTVVVGSQNWSDSANHTNDENILVIKNARIAKLYKQEFERVESGSRKGPSKSLMKRISQMENACSGSFYREKQQTIPLKY